MKNLKQLVLPCYKLEMAMSVEAWYFLHGSTDGICYLTYLLVEDNSIGSTKHQTGIGLCRSSQTGGRLHAGTGQGMGHRAQGGVPSVGGFLGTRANPC